ncbi:SECIS-binding protein 2 [Pteropus alecto]|uniref:SECIS-binding protein 2 n=1 Tax=Pteropus alecto TaxID=9402 RepID=L5JWS0_PTEAL|nr:SECIS-binding protein 2 [Pteropus alecto]
MASEGPREPAGEGIKLSADVKPFVPKFAGLSVAWLESSEAPVFPSCATTYYPSCVQELPVPEQKLYPEDMAFGASTFPPQYLSSEMALHPYTYSPYTLESTQNVCPVPDSQYDYSQPSCYQGYQMVKPQYEHMCPLSQDTKALFKKKCGEQKFDSKKAGGTISSDIKSVKGSHHMSIHADTNLKSDGYHKRADKKPSIIEKSGPASKPEFEFTGLDFPELQGAENSVMLETPKQPKWGPLRSASTNTSLVREVVKPTVVLTEGEIVVKNNNPTDSVTDNAATIPSSCTRELSWTPMGYVVRQTLPTELSQAPRNVTSVINLKTVASSADPKNGSMSASQVLSSHLSYNREKPVVHPTKKSKASQGGGPEQHEASRKNKKKEEKSKSKYEVLTVQEPPRIEDAEEFPNLAVASERRDRVESPKFQSKQRPQIPSTPVEVLYSLPVLHLALAPRLKPSASQSDFGIEEENSGQDSKNEGAKARNNFKSSGKKSQIPVQLDLGGMLTALEKQQHSQNAKHSSKPVVFSVGAVPVLSKETMSGKKGHHFSPVKTPHNPLDSSAPLMKKGKQREVPKAKKPTSLKKQPVVCGQSQVGKECLAWGQLTVKLHGRNRAQVVHTLVRTWGDALLQSPVATVRGWMGTLPIILKERQERKQQRLQENAVSSAFTSDDVQDVESSGDDLTLEQAPGEAEASLCSARESKSEEPLGAEIHKEAETYHLGPDGTGCPKIHSRRFRDYCSQVLSKEVDACVMDLLKELVRFQDRMYQKDPIKAKTKRRLVLGLREVLKHLRLRKLKCVIISPNCEKIQSKGGLDDTLHTIIDYACKQDIPFVFALNRKALGRSLNKAVPVSVVGIFSYDGAQDQFHKMVELTVAARQAYKTMLENVRQELAGEPGPQTSVELPAQGPSCSAEDSSPAPSKTEEPHYIEIWRKHLEVYSQCALELEESLEASTSQMMNLNL